MSRRSQGPRLPVPGGAALWLLIRGVVRAPSRPDLLLGAVLLTAVLLPASALPLSAQQGEADGRRSLAAHRLPEDAAVELDGRLREAFWEAADVATGFLQQTPREGAPATEGTEVRVAYDRQNLYLGAVLHDSRPDGVLAHKRRRDAGLGPDDRFMWILDTFRDRRTAYFFEINPAGLMGDGLMGSGFNKSWDGIWEAAVHRDEGGWSAEIRIPFSTLDFEPDRGTWGINFQRTVRRKEEESLWEGHRTNQGLFNPTYAGDLTGLRDLSQGLGLEVRPYVVGSWRHEPGLADPTDVSMDAGFDLSYSLTPGLRAAVTVNTDFAEVEVDQRRVNLTRFPLFFPEKRDFFLAGSDVYTFAPRNDQRPFFSRRIGLVEGREVPIDAGLRLGGQAGAYELGFLQVRTGDSRAVPAEDFTVARVKRRLLGESYLGAIYTRRATEAEAGAPGPPDRHTVGLDLLLFTSGFLGDRNLRGQLFGVWHSDPAREGASTFGDRSSRGARVSYPNDLWNAHVSYREFGAAFDPAAGFVRRNGFRRLQPSLSFNPRPASPDWLRQASVGLRFEDLWSLEGVLLTRERSVTLPGLDLESGDRIEARYRWSSELLREPFEISEGVEVPAGRYDVFDARLEVATARRRTVSGRLSLTRGGFWSGDRTRWEGSLTLRPATGLSARGEVVRNDVDLPQGAFTAHVARFIGEWHPTPWISLTQNWQYDDVSETLGLQARLRWIVRPGSELIAVYTHNWREEAGGLAPREGGLGTLSRDLATKLVYSLTF